MKVLLIVIVNFISSLSIAQSRGYAGYIRIGTMNVSSARNALPIVVPGIAAFTSTFTGIGGELEYRVNRTVFDAELMMMSHGPVSSGDRYAEPFTGAAMFKTGYVTFYRKNFLVYPNAGVGFGSVLVNTYQKSGDVKKELHTIYLIQPVFDLGLSSNLIVYRFKNDISTGVLPVGARAGYRFSSTSNKWHRVEKLDASSANYSMRGWYVSVALGMGYISSKPK